MEYFFYFVTVSHEKKILQENLLRSQMISDHSLTVQKGFKNIPEALNCTGVRDIAPVGAQVIVVYVHHDVFLPPTFESDLCKALDQLPDDWAVCGPAGVRLLDGKKESVGYISDRGRLWGHPIGRPQEVQTLDELMLITKGDMMFDEKFAFDFYGADICMQANNSGKKCYAINAFVEHNSSREVGGRTPEFYLAEKAFRFKWFRSLPIVTTCSLLI